MKIHELDSLLTFGTIGHNHLLTAAQKAFSKAEAGREGGAAALERGIRLLCMAWMEFPLNAPLAAQIVSLSQKSPLVGQFAKPNGLHVAAQIAQMQNVDDPIAQTLFSREDYVGLLDHFDGVAAKGGASAIVRQAVMLSSMLSAWEWLYDFLTGPVAQAVPGVVELLLPDILLADGRYEQAVDACEKLVATCGLPLAGFRLAMAHAGLGDRDTSLNVLNRVLRENPMHVSALLALDALAYPARRDVRLPGKCVVSIYSYNKAGELARTLESVLASDLGSDVGDVHVRVLINGSTDDSLAVAERARAGYTGSMDIVSLPVNVGAPAARNWLLDAALRDGAEWIVYLDDDVLVPTDWLRGLSAGTEDFPEAGVWGCRVVDAVSPSLTQHCDGFLLDGDDALKHDHFVVLHEPGVECLVPQFLGHRRYCASVTGCCHLFRVETLATNKGFDLQFSPSQFDDLDSDLRLLQSGKPAAYLGDITITHLRKANQFFEQSEAARIQGESHRALLEERHVRHLDKMLEVQKSFVRGDLESKKARLQESIS